MTVACLKETAPALFDASSDTGTEARQIVERRLRTPAAELHCGVGPARIRDVVRAAALTRKLSAAEADAVGDAVVERLLGADL